MRQFPWRRLALSVASRERRVDGGRLVSCVHTGAYAGHRRETAPVARPAALCAPGPGPGHHGLRCPPQVRQTRGKKTKSTVRLEDLPQGALPGTMSEGAAAAAAAADEPEDAGRAYPTVVLQARRNMQKFDNCVLLTRVGGFYELYFDQVETFAPLLGLKKAKRRTLLGDVPMAGFQHWTLEKYLKVLVRDHGLKGSSDDRERSECSH